MYFRPLTSDDLDRAPPWFNEIELRADGWRDDHTRSVIAIDAGQVVAAGIIWTSRVHDDRYWVDIVVDPQQRRQGIGTRVFGHLRTLRRWDLNFMTRGYVGEPSLTFADALGARTIQVVPPEFIDTSNRTALRPATAVVPGSQVDSTDLLAANAAVYEWIHASWSPVAPSFAAALNKEVTEDLDLAATSVALSADGTIRAVAMVHHETVPPVLTAESVDPRDPDGERLVEGCVRAALDVLAARDVEQVEFDGHVSDPHLFPNWIKLDPAGRWFRLVEIPPHVSG